MVQDKTKVWLELGRLYKEFKFFFLRQIRFSLLLENKDAESMFGVLSKNVI